MTTQPLEQQADVVVIGGGIAGCATAYYLAKRGAKVVLVEKGQINHEQSSRNIGFVRQQGRHPWEIPYMRESIKLWEGLPAELNSDIEWIQGGGLRLAVNDKDLKLLEEVTKIDRDLGLDTKLLTRAQVQELEPALQGKFLGAMYTWNDGQAEPPKVAPAFARAAQEHGAKVYPYCAVNGLVVANRQVQGVVTERGEIKAPVVVCAAGAWSSKLSRMVGLDLPQRVVRSTAAETEPVRPITKLAVWGGRMITFRQRARGSFYLGGGGGVDVDVDMDVFRHLGLYLPNFFKNWRGFRFHLGELPRDVGRRMPWSEARKHPFAHAVDLEPRPNLARIERARRILGDFAPALKDIKLERVWAGRIDTTPDAVPVLGTVEDLNGWVFNTGGSGHGFMQGPIYAKLVSEVILDGQPSIDIRRFRFSRFKERDLAPPEGVF
ncbi:MAG: FAD-binding oxidoreductase [Chloroflexi bacterium]|nr:FAD-binding oxidoreductase [Chloroflexota bacterium]